jgi:hypothetical protein
MTAVQRAGLSVAKVECDASGKISVIPGRPVESDAKQQDELSTWMKDHAHSTQGP